MASPPRTGLLQGAAGIIVPGRSMNENKALRQGGHPLDPHSMPSKLILVPKPCGASPPKQKASYGLPPLLPTSQSDEVLPMIPAAENSPQQPGLLDAKPRAGLKDNHKQKWRSIEPMAPIPLETGEPPMDAEPMPEGATPSPILAAAKRNVKRPVPNQRSLLP
jgi:hypothetical protein